MRTFTRKSNMQPGKASTGDIVYADDVNELQEAIEDMQTGDLVWDVPLAGIADALGEYEPLQSMRGAELWADNFDTPQDAINAAATAGGGVVRMRMGEYADTSLTLRSYVYLEGAGHSSVVGGTTLTGVDASTDIITLEEGATYCGVRNMNLYGGRDQIVTGDLSTYISLDHAGFLAPAQAGVHVHGQAQEWQSNVIRASGGQYWWWQEHDGPTSLFDKSTFTDVAMHGQSINCVKVEVGVSNNITWINPQIIHVNQDAFYLDGGLRQWVFINANNEGVGYNGDNAFTTGTISSASNSLVVASATGFAISDAITVKGAGVGGADLQTTVTNIVGTTFTLVDAASVSVTSVWTTNAIYSVFKFGNSIAASADITWVGGQIGARKTDSGVRYAIDASVAGNFLILGSATDGGAQEIPVYDPQNVVNQYGFGRAIVRKPVSSRFALTNVTTDLTLDANSTTTAEVADVLGTLIAKLQAQGIVP